MRININDGAGGPEAVFTIDEDGVVTLHGSPDLFEVRDAAQGQAAGPPLWAGPLEYLRRWSQEQGHTRTEIGVPNLPSEPGVVY